jgi:hypothetical protein
MRGRLWNRNMPHMTNLAGAVIFVVRTTMGVGYSLCPKCEHPQNQRQHQHSDGERFSHGVFPGDPNLQVATMARVTCVRSQRRDDLNSPFGCFHFSRWANFRGVRPYTPSRS